MTIKEIIKEYNIRVKEEKILQMSRFIHKVKFPSLKIDKYLKKKIKEGNYTVVDYPDGLSSIIKNWILIYLKKHPECKRKREYIITGKGI